MTNATLTDIELQVMKEKEVEALKLRNLGLVMGGTAEYRTHDGHAYTGRIVGYCYGDVEIDATVFEYRPQFVSRPAPMVRMA